MANTPSLPPMPALPGFAQVALVKAQKIARQGKGLTFWALPGACAAAWLAYPALTDDFKVSVGLMSPPAESK